MADHQFRVLGPLEVEHPGGSLTVVGARQQILLTMLLLHANQVVPVSRLVEAIWDDMPPSTALAQVRICVCRLRRTFARLGLEDAIRTHSSGYLLQATADSCDLVRFEDLLGRGRAAAASGHTVGAAALFRAALALWRGPAADGLESPLLQAVVSRASEERAAALEECFDLELQQGMHRTIVGELFIQASAYPYRERLSAQLMLALYRSDRQAEALEVYRNLRHRLDEELGIEPGSALRRLQQDILAQDPRLVESFDTSRFLDPEPTPGDEPPAAQQSAVATSLRPAARPWAAPDRKSDLLHQLEWENAWLRTCYAARQYLLGNFDRLPSSAAGPARAHVLSRNSLTRNRAS
ncbi:MULTISPECIES: AfsR/SARP family transcriptional regulator [Kitasatospora]|uniref:AfsR/SARP family transcriptional regulator n=1 Tax=Kitasatospora TaxID=2063 RepID=UPI000CA89320|nr:AfsR/SARP family transcriptional regulator [Kitasatospora sp. GP30]MDH6142622.1 DNA-binding SARP family transcriptional activator [Kitasatospora sp. GP30]